VVRISAPNMVLRFRQVGQEVNLERDESQPRLIAVDQQQVLHVCRSRAEEKAFRSLSRLAAQLLPTG
jgi:hypothetical protein